MGLTYTFRHSATDPVRGTEVDVNLDDIAVAVNALTAGSSSFTTISLSALAVAPTPAQGLIYFNSVDQQFYGCKDGVSWSILG